MKTALKIAPAAEKSRFAAPAAGGRRGVALRLVAPASTAIQSTALRSVRSGGHERVLRTLDRLALLGMVVAIALMPVLAASRANERPAVAPQAVAPVGDREGSGFSEALTALGYAIWRPTPSLNRPVQSPPRQDRDAPAPRHFQSTN